MVALLIRSPWTKPVKKPRNRAEQSFHMTVARYLDLALPKNCVWTTFPSGGGGLLRGKFLKAMGLRAGWPDIQILVGHRMPFSIATATTFIGLELKAPSKYAQKSQRKCHEAIEAVGGHVYVVRTLDDIYGVLSAFVTLNAKPS